MRHTRRTPVEQRAERRGHARRTAMFCLPLCGGGCRIRAQLELPASFLCSAKQSAR